MTAADPQTRDRPAKRRRRRARRWTVAVVISLLFLLVGWVGVRALLAKSELESAVPLAVELENQVLAQETDMMGRTAAELDQHIESAAALTGDPIYRFAERVPWAGPNLTAMRQLISVVRGLSDDAVGPMTKLAATFQIADFKPEDGRLDVQPLIKARPILENVSLAVRAAQKATAAIDTNVTVEPIRSATKQLVAQLADVAGPVDAMKSASVLIPDMLGNAGDRNYLLLFQNPAELRASGGISGAVALLSAKNGMIQLSAQASSGDFPEFDGPVLPLSDETRGLYGDITGQYIQNVNLTPDFPTSAALAGEMWRQTFGVEVDGVLSIDPVALSYVLGATGPVTIATGDTLTAENAVELLLRDVYLRYANPADQDIFFAAAASAVFDKVSTGDLDPAKLIQALATAGHERRISIWSASTAEQNVLATTTLSGSLNKRSDDLQPFGVYLNDATASKMDFYLDVRISDGQITCRNDKRPNYGVTVTLKNTAPFDAATTFPPYVTGDGVFGVTPGNIKTIVNVYGTPELQNLGVARDGAAVPYLPATDAGYQVSQIAIELAPGESTTLQFGFLGDAPFDGEVVTEQTPVIYRHETQRLTLACDFPLW